MRTSLRLTRSRIVDNSAPAKRLQFRNVRSTGFPTVFPSLFIRQSGHERARAGQLIVRFNFDRSNRSTFPPSVLGARNRASGSSYAHRNATDTRAIEFRTVGGLSVTWTNFTE